MPSSTILTSTFGSAVIRQITVGAIALSIVFSASPCRAQRGEDIAKGLLRALIESQLDKSRRRSQQTIPRPPNGRGIPGQIAETPQILQLRPIAASLSQESATLVSLLRSDSQRNPGARSHLSEAIRLQANASAIRQRVDSQRNHVLVQDDFQNFNSEWSTLSHHLNECAGVSSRTRTCLKRIATLDRQYCSILGIQEQFNNRELVRSAYTLTTYSRDLIDDIKDSYRPGNRHRQLLRDVGRYAQKTDYFATLASQGNPYSTVVSSFKDVYETWRTLEPKLVEYSNHGTVRTISRIQDSFRNIHGLLRLEMGMDKTQVLHLVHAIDEEITQIFRTITLEQLMTLPDGQAVPNSADALFGTIQNLDDLIRRDQSPQEIGEAWVYADEAWTEFEFYMSPIQSPPTVQGLRNIADSMLSLKQTLGVTVQYDRDVLVRTASTLEFLTNQLLRTVQKWNQKTGNRNSGLIARIQQLEAAMHRIEQALTTGISQRNHLREADQAIALWQQIRPELKVCETDERVELDHIAGSITSEGLKLRTMLGD